MTKKEVNKAMLIIMDGWGIAKPSKTNAISTAKTPVIDLLKEQALYTQIRASGEAVGLPKGFIGNSEVGHIHIGAGRKIPQDLLKINKEIKSGKFFKNKVLIDAIKKAKTRKGALHLLGLVSDGGVHSHIDHLFALIDLAIKLDVTDIHIHALLDGRDVPPKSAAKYLKQVDDYLKKKKVGCIETIMGRFYGMDRDNRWNREHKAYDALVNCNGSYFDTWKEALDAAYEKGETDEFVEPSIIRKQKDICPMREKDTVIFFNFRSDRARQLTKAFVQGLFNKFKRKHLIGLEFVSMTEYDKKIKCPVAYPPQKPGITMGSVIADAGLRQFRIAETEKYAHVTYFMNNGREVPNHHEERLLIPSPHVEKYDETPKMSAEKITQEVIKRLDEQKYDFIALNFANADMVGHTGNFNAAVKAVEYEDACIGRVLKACIKNNYNLLITADHGNAEEMGKGHETAHSLNDVPCFIITTQNVKMKRKKFALYNIAPTILKIMGLKIPREMEESILS